MRIVNTLVGVPTDNLGKLAWYNAFDVLSVLEIHPQLSSLLTETKRKTYLFELELAAPLLEMEFNGTHVDIFERERLIRETEAEVAQINSILHELCEAIGYYSRYITIARHEFSAASGIPFDELPASWPDWTARPVQWRRWVKLQAPHDLPAYQKALKVFALPFNGRSSDQKKRLFYDFFGHYDNTVSKELSPNFPPPFNKSRGISEIKSRDANNEYTPSSDRAALEKIQSKYTGDPRDAYTLASPFVSLCLEASDLGKTLDFLRCKLEKGLFRSSFACATETGRLSSRANSQGYGSNGQNVAPKLRSIFTVPLGYKFAALDYEQIESRIVGAICYRLFGAINYLLATESGDMHSLACSMVWDDMPWPADFTFEWLLKHGPFPKDMLKAAKKIAGVEFYRGKSRRDVSKTLGHGCLTGDHEVLTPAGWVPISEKPPVIMQWPGQLVPVSNWIDKEYYGEFIQWEGQSISTTITTDHRVYYSTMSEQDIKTKPAIEVPRSGKILLGNSYLGGQVAEPFARLLAAYHCDGNWTGYGQVRFHFHKQRKIDRIKMLAKQAGVSYIHYTDESSLAINWRPNLHAPNWSMLDWSADSLAAYMDEIPYWDGHFGKTSTSVFSKHKEWLELWQTFNRLLGYGGNIQKSQISGFGTEMHSLQINNRKLANRTSFTTDTLYTDRAQVYCPTVPSKAFYVRRNKKIHVTGNSNYLGQPPQMSRHSHIDIGLIQHYQSVYFSAFPEIKKWHRWVVEQVQTVGEITTMLGRTRQFFGRPTDDATIREAVAFEPQSVGADYTNSALLSIYKANLPIELVLQKHDELVSRFREEDEQLVIDAIARIMERRVTLTSPTGTTREWYVPAEVETGWNLGKRRVVYNKETGELLKILNPDGLASPMERARETNPFDFMRRTL